MPSRDGLASSRIASLRFEGWRNPGAAPRERYGGRSMRFKRAVQARGGRKGGKPAQDGGAVLSCSGRRESLKTTGVMTGAAKA